MRTNWTEITEKMKTHCGNCYRVNAMLTKLAKGPFCSSCRKNNWEGPLFFERVQGETT